MNRTPLLEPSILPCTFDESLMVRTLAPVELIAGKVKAVYDRVAARDIYDLYHIESAQDLFLHDGDPEKRLMRHRVLLFYAALSDRLPKPLEEPLSQRFTKQRTGMDKLRQVVYRSEDLPELSNLVARAQAFINEQVLPTCPDEDEFLNVLRRGEFLPRLLFSDWPDVLDHARTSPMAAWRMDGMRRLLSKPASS